MNLSNWGSLDGDHKAMVNTNMVITCPLGTNCTSLKSTPGANIISPVSMFLTGTIAHLSWILVFIAGNAVALLVLHGNSKREQMRTVFYLLIKSLLWTDVTGIILTSIPVLIVYSNGHWVGSTGLCNYHAFTMISIGLITPCLVCTMAVERFLGIRLPYFYKQHVNRHRVRLVLLVQWIGVLLFTSLPFFGFGQYARQYPGTWCFFDLHATQIVHVIYAFFFAGFIIALIVVIIACNIAVIATLIGLMHRRKHLSSPSRDPRQTNRPSTHDHQREVEIQMVLLLVGITLLFTICWMPLMIQVVLNQFVAEYKTNHRRDLLAIRLVSINQTFDPWIYILFRKVLFTKVWHFLLRMFTGKRPKIKNTLELEKGRRVPRIASPPSDAAVDDRRALAALPTTDAAVIINGAYCHNCESQYGDGHYSSTTTPNSKVISSSGESSGNCPDAAGTAVDVSTATTTNEDDDDDDDDQKTAERDEEDDNDSALDAEEPNSSSAEFTATVKTMTTTMTAAVAGSGRCQNCRQLINACDAAAAAPTATGRWPSSRRHKSWRPLRRPEASTLLGVKFLRKHSTKRNLPIASELSLDDNSRSVKSAIL